MKNNSRKLIQIVDCPDTTVSQGCIFGLCDDGTLWAYQHGSWSLVSPYVPQYSIDNEDEQK